MSSLERSVSKSKHLNVSQIQFSRTLRSYSPQQSLQKKKQQSRVNLESPISQFPAKRMSKSATKSSFFNQNVKSEYQEFQGAPVIIFMQDQMNLLRDNSDAPLDSIEKFLNGPRSLLKDHVILPSYCPEAQSQFGFYILKQTNFWVILWTYLHALGMESNRFSQSLLKNIDQTMKLHLHNKDHFNLVQNFLQKTNKMDQQQIIDEVEEVSNTKSENEKSLQRRKSSRVGVRKSQPQEVSTVIDLKQWEVKTNQELNRLQDDNSQNYLLLKSSVKRNDTNQIVDEGPLHEQKITKTLFSYGFGVPSKVIKNDPITNDGVSHVDIQQQSPHNESINFLQDVELKDEYTLGSSIEVKLENISDLSQLVDPLLTQNESRVQDNISQQTNSMQTTTLDQSRTRLNNNSRAQSTSSQTESGKQKKLSNLIWQKCGILKKSSDENLGSGYIYSLQKASKFIHQAHGVDNMLIPCRVSFRIHGTDDDQVDQISASSLVYVDNQHVTDSYSPANSRSQDIQQKLDQGSIQLQSQHRPSLKRRSSNITPNRITVFEDQYEARDLFNVKLKVKKVWNANFNDKGLYQLVEITDENQQSLGVQGRFALVQIRARNETDLEEDIMKDYFDYREFVHEQGQTTQIMSFLGQ